MDINQTTIVEKRIQKVICKLEKNNMQGFIAKNQDELFKIIAELIKNDCKMISGGSMTLKETGVMDFLNKNYNGKFMDRAGYEGNALEKLYRDAFFCDTFFSSTNAITENGELFNVDGTGNRVAAMIFGPKQVIIVAGFNKIVSDLKAAEERVKKLSAPTNAIRLGISSACSYSGECMNCSGDNRICCSSVVLSHQRIKNRIKVILLTEAFGY